MKYLKKIFEAKSMLDTNNLGDILQEITDLGYLSHVQSHWWSDDRGNDISITIYGKNEYDKKFECEVAYIYPDDIIEVVERLVRYLLTEGYKIEEDGSKKIDAINKRPTTKTKDKIEVSISRYSKVDMIWDNKINGYKITDAMSLYFRQA